MVDKSKGRNIRPFFYAEILKGETQVEILLKNGFVYTDNDFIKADLLIKDGRIVDISKNIDVCCDVVPHAGLLLPKAFDHGICDRVAV